MIHRRNLFRGFLFYLLMLTLIVLIFVFGILHFFSTTVFSQVESELNHTAVMVWNLLLYAEQQGGVDYDRFCKRAGADGETRITLIASDGRVLGDSHARISDLNNHGDRPEVIQAMHGAYGVSIRQSSSLGYRLMYFALPVELHGESMILRTSRSVSAIDGVLSQARRTLLFGSLAFFLLALYAAASTGQWIRRPLRRLVTVAEDLGEGNLSARAEVETPEELRILGDTLNSMAERLDRRIESIQRQRDEYQSVLSGMSEAVVVLDANLCVLETNRAAESIFLQSREEMLSKPLLKAVRNLKLQEFAERLLTSSGPLTEEFTLHLNETSGRALYMQVHGAALTNHAQGSGQARGVLVFTDITGIKQSEQIRKDFVSNVSHELKTPITSIKGFVETLQDGAGSDPELLARFLGIIGKQADNMHAIIEDLLQLSRLDERSLGMVEATIDLHDVVQSAVERVKESAREKRMRIGLEGGAGLLVRGNQGLLEQAVFNLLDNAVKYSEPEGEVRTRLKKEQGSVVISVGDTGLGIPEEDLPRIFERFYRVDKARSRETGGTGLGLAIVKHIVIVHGGSVSVDSTPGRGSTFTVTLPIAPDGAP